MEKAGEKVKEYFDNRTTDACDDALWNEASKLGLVETHEIQLYEWEHYGSECPVCKKPWVKITFENKLGKIEYFQPQCNCMPKCVYCGRLLIIELALKLPDCMVCFHNKSNDEWRLHPCGKYKTVQKSGKYESSSSEYKRCDGWMKLLNRQGEYMCDKCGRKEKRVKA